MLKIYFPFHIHRKSLCEWLSYLINSWISELDSTCVRLSELFSRTTREGRHSTLTRLSILDHSGETHPLVLCNIEMNIGLSLLVRLKFRWRHPRGTRIICVVTKLAFCVAPFAWASYLINVFIRDLAAGVLGRNWEGPYQIEQVLPPGTYKLARLNGN